MYLCCVEVMFINRLTSMFVVYAAALLPARSSHALPFIFGSLDHFRC